MHYDFDLQSVILFRPRQWKYKWSRFTMLIRSVYSIIVVQSTLLCGPLQKAQTLFEGSVSFPLGCIATSTAV